MADDPFLTIRDFYIQKGTFLENGETEEEEETIEVKKLKDKRKYF